MKKGFSSEKYLLAQKAKVLERIKKFGRLYLEIGGKLVYDNHASRVLPGYKKTTKINLVKQLGSLEIIYCVNAKDLQSHRTLGKNKLTYEQQVLKDLKDIQKFRLNPKFIVITRYNNEEKARELKSKLEKLGKKVFFHTEVKGYLDNPQNAINGFKIQPYVPVEKNLIILTGPASGSGKMAVALNQIYHEEKQKHKTGFAKIETFPIWNLPINHPINLAYEAATADLQDKNMIDPYHKKAYNINAVNYNSDIMNFEILKKIVQEITGKKNPFGYKSPTDMGINEAKKAIIDEDICKRAAIKEIKNRYTRYLKEFKQGRESKKTINRMNEILKKVTN
jgi:uncharacterized protein (UPF0371 family)